MCNTLFKYVKQVLVQTGIYPGLVNEANGMDKDLENHLVYKFWLISSHSFQNEIQELALAVFMSPIRKAGDESI